MNQNQGLNGTCRLEAIPRDIIMIPYPVCQATATHLKMDTLRFHLRLPYLKKNGCDWINTNQDIMISPVAKESIAIIFYKQCISHIHTHIYIYIYVCIYHRYCTLISHIGSCTKWPKVSGNIFELLNAFLFYKKSQFWIRSVDLWKTIILCPQIGDMDSAVGILDQSLEMGEFRDKIWK